MVKNMTAKRILLINMPFAFVNIPAPGISLLKSNIIQNTNALCDIAYFNINFAELIGVNLYRIIGFAGMPENPEDAISPLILPGEWLFSQYFYGLGSLDAKEYINTILRNTPVPDGTPLKTSEKSIKQLLQLRSVTGLFLNDCFKSVDWNKYFLVGFTSLYAQNMASLCLARMIKKNFPDIYIAFGGANCEDTMGYELIKQYDFIDCVCTGEGDYAVPMLVNSLLNVNEPENIKGLVWRNSYGQCIDNGPADLVINLDDFEPPDFDDFFIKFNSSHLNSECIPAIPIQGTRGCWWGEKKQCTFCGGNGRKIKYRRKSPERVMHELLYYTNRYGVKKIWFLDDILDFKYFDTLIPELITKNLNLTIGFETKSNLKKEQLLLLKKAGIEVLQPGIESFSTNILKSMNKGVKGLQNLAFLKWSKKYGIHSLWSLLYGFPDEDPHEYEKQFEIIKRITHLDPPMDIIPIDLLRFSPNYNNASKNGFINVRPLSAYNYIYPFDEETLSKIAYFFDYEYTDKRVPYEYVHEIIKFWWLEWRETFNDNSLIHYSKYDKTGFIIDKRFNRKLNYILLDEIQNAIYNFCDSPRAIPDIIKYLQSTFPYRDFETENVFKFLNYMIEAYFMVEEADNYLSVAISND